MGTVSRDELARTIDHTLLKADATSAAIEKLCDEAKKYGFASVCVNSTNVVLASRRLSGSSVKVCSVVGFPLGAMAADAKAYEAAAAACGGALEIDMVMNIGAMKSADYERVKEDMTKVVQATKQANPDTLVKVIIETCYLTDDEKVRACNMAVAAGAGFVKTSTGLGPKGATVEDVKLMRATVGPTIGVKAAGGIRTFDDAMAMINAGANRIGTSAGPTIIDGYKE